MFVAVSQHGTSLHLQGVYVSLACSTTSQSVHSQLPIRSMFSHPSAVFQLTEEQQVLPGVLQSWLDSHGNMLCCACARECKAVGLE